MHPFPATYVGFGIEKWDVMPRYFSEGHFFSFHSASR
jgi:hypothetical protein